MIKVQLNKRVKYAGEYKAANTPFEIKDEDKDELLKAGAHIIEESVKEAKGGTQVPSKPSKPAGPYDAFKRADFDEELTKRGLNPADCKNTKECLAALLEDDEKKKTQAELFELLKVEAAELEIEIPEDATVEALEALIAAKHEELGSGEGEIPGEGQAGEGQTPPADTTPGEGEQGAE